MCVCVCVCVGRAHGADDFLPVMMYVLARSNLSNLQLDVEYMMELMDPSLALGEGTHWWQFWPSRYCKQLLYMCQQLLTHIQMCILHIWSSFVCAGSYYLTTTYGALEHIKTFDQQRSATRQLSREVQDSIHRWERRRTLNQERMAQGSVRVHTHVINTVIGITQSDSHDKRGIDLYSVPFWVCTMAQCTVWLKGNFQ